MVQVVNFGLPENKQKDNLQHGNLSAVLTLSL